jgi:RING finger protein 121
MSMIRMHQKHAGHGDMHAEMILILLAVLLVSQVLLVQWKKHRPHSYHLCTLLGNYLALLGNFSYFLV